MMPPLEVEIEHRWSTIVRGPRSWEFCNQAARQKPTWSRAGRGWIVTERTARDVVAMAEAAGLNVVVTGPRMAAAAASERTADAPPANVEAGLW